MYSREQKIIDVEEAIASLRLEGLEPTEISLKYAQKYIDGEITVDEMVELGSAEVRRSVLDGPEE